MHNIPGIRPGHDVFLSCCYAFLYTPAANPSVSPGKWQNAVDIFFPELHFVCFVGLAVPKESRTNTVLPQD